MYIPHSLCMYIIKQSVLTEHNKHVCLCMYKRNKIPLLRLIEIEIFSKISQISASLASGDFKTGRFSLRGEKQRFHISLGDLTSFRRSFSKKFSATSSSSAPAPGSESWMPHCVVRRPSKIRGHPFW